MSLTRRLLLITGVVLLAALWLGPMPRLASHAFHAHMAMHMGVVAVAAPLIALGVAASRFDPVPRAPALVFSAVPASMLELVIVWSWHSPALHHWARHDVVGLVLEQGTFLASGLVLWLAVLGGRARDCRRAAEGIVGLLLTSMHMTLLGALLALSPNPLYGHAAVDEQHLGGAIMLLVGGGSYLTGGLWLTAELLSSQRENRA